MQPLFYENKGQSGGQAISGLNGSDNGLHDGQTLYVSVFPVLINVSSGYRFVTIDLGLSIPSLPIHTLL